MLQNWSNRKYSQSFTRVSFILIFPPYIIHHPRVVDGAWTTREYLLETDQAATVGLGVVGQSFRQPVADDIADWSCRTLEEGRADRKRGDRNVVAATASAAELLDCWWHSPAAPSFDPLNSTAALHDTFERQSSLAYCYHRDRYPHNKSPVCPTSDPSVFVVPVWINYSRRID